MSVFSRRGNSHYIGGGSNRRGASTHIGSHGKGPGQDGQIHSLGCRTIQTLTHNSEAGYYAAVGSTSFPNTEFTADDIMPSFLTIGQADAITACFSEYSRRVLKRSKSQRVPIREQLKRAAAELARQPSHKKERAREAVHEDR